MFKREFEVFNQSNGALYVVDQSDEALLCEMPASYVDVGHHLNYVVFYLNTAVAVKWK